jgi:hypothetical protein
MPAPAQSVKVVAAHEGAIAIDVAAALRVDPVEEGENDADEEGAEDHKAGDRGVTRRRTRTTKATRAEAPRRSEQLRSGVISPS